MRPESTPTAVSAAIHGSFLFRVLVAFHTLNLEGLSHLVDNFVFTVGYSRRGRQITRLPGFSLAHLLNNLYTPAEMLEEEIPLCLGAFLVNNAARLFHLGIFRLRLGEQCVFRTTALIGKLVLGIDHILVVGIGFVVVHLCVKQGIAPFALVAILQIHVVVGLIEHDGQFERQVFADLKPLRDNTLCVIVPTFVAVILAIRHEITGAIGIEPALAFLCFIVNFHKNTSVSIAAIPSGRSG